MPKVSVLIPAYNVEAYITDAVTSMIHQTYHDIEILIADDCSKDRTWSIMQELAKKDQRIKIFQNEQNMHVSRTLNFLASKAKGDFICRMDGDDWSYPERVAQQVTFLQEHPGVGIVGGNIEVCDENMNIIKRRSYYQSDAEIRAHIFFFSPFAHPSVMIRKNILDSSGLYNPSLSGAEDYDLYFRIGTISAFASIPKTILKLRLNQKSVSASSGNKQEKMTLYIRQKAVYEYGYKMGLKACLYWILQVISLVVPFKLKYWLFMKIR